MKKFMIKTKRIYETPLSEDGLRILVDRLWPRGVSKEEARIDFWYKQIAPSNELRGWFSHKPELFKEFTKKYAKELESQKQILEEIKNKAKKEQVTLLYAAKDTEFNNAIALKKILEEIKA